MIDPIETERLILREWTPEDLPPFARINADPLIMEHMPRLLPPKDSDKLVKKFQAHFKTHGFGLYAVENKEDGAFIGTVGLQNVEFKSHFTPAVEIAWRLDYSAWGKGFATESARAVLDYGFSECGLDKIVSFTVHDNTASIHVMEKIGMREAKDSRFQYPSLRKDHPLGEFVLYDLSKAQYEKDVKAA